MKDYTLTNEKNWDNLTSRGKVVRLKHSLGDVIAGDSETLRTAKGQTGLHPEPELEMGAFQKEEATLCLQVQVLSAARHSAWNLA